MFEQNASGETMKGSLKLNYMIGKWSKKLPRRWNKDFLKIKS